MASRKKTKINPAKKTAERAASGYKIESGIEKPKGVAVAGKTPERLTLEKLKVGQSFAIADRKKRKRLIDICYRLKQSTGKIFSVISTDKETRVWRDK